ncbi:MAG: hypothetical protein SFV15_17490 [Polyangiaceae bacterium]|nr:hypothetical protein [Polyangiaceae bacterium]
MSSHRGGSKVASAVSSSANEAEPSTPPAPRVLLEQVSQESLLLNSRANLQVALRIGEILDRYLREIHGTPREPKRSQSYREIAEAAKLGRSPCVLWRCVQIHALAQKLPEIRTFVHLSTTHVRAVVNLPLEAQRLLLTQAEGERWTCVRLEKAASELRRGPLRVVDAPEKGRQSGFFASPGADVLRGVNTALRHLRRAQQHAGGPLPAHIKQDIEQKLQQLEQACAEVKEACTFSSARASQKPHESS